MTQRPPAETGPLYNVPLIDALPLGDGGYQQKMPSRKDLILCEHSHKRVAAGYEVLLAHYRQVCDECDMLKHLLSKAQLSQALHNIELDSLQGTVQLIKDINHDNSTT